MQTPSEGPKKSAYNVSAFPLDGSDFRTSHSVAVLAFLKMSRVSPSMATSAAP